MINGDTGRDTGCLSHPHTLGDTATSYMGAVGGGEASSGYK